MPNLVLTVLYALSLFLRASFNVSTNKMNVLVSNVFTGASKVLGINSFGSGTTIKPVFDYRFNSNKHTSYAFVRNLNTSFLGFYCTNKIFSRAIWVYLKSLHGSPRSVVPFGSIILRHSKMINAQVTGVGGGGSGGATAPPKVLIW